MLFRSKHSDIEGYNGLPINAMVVKSRSSIGGTIARQEFSQEYGFNPILTLINFASDKGLIKGINPNRYFESNTDVKFDTRKFVKEVEERPELVDALLDATRPELDKLIPTFDLRETDSMNPLTSAKGRASIRDRLRRTT